MKKIINTNDKSVQLAEEIKSHLEKIFGALKNAVKIIVVNEDYEVYVNVGGCFLVYVNFREKCVETLEGDEMVKDYLFDLVRIETNPGVMYYSDMSGEPPSEEEVDICTKESTLMAACEVAKLYIEMIIYGVAEGIEEAKMFEEDDEYLKSLMNPEGEKP